VQTSNELICKGKTRLLLAAEQSVIKLDKLKLSAFLAAGLVKVKDVIEGVQPSAGGA